jgi:hypothetical protein
MKNLNEGIKKLKKSMPRVAAVVPYTSNTDLNLSSVDKPVSPFKDDASEKHIDSGRPMEEY